MLRFNEKKMQSWAATSPIHGPVRSLGNMGGLEQNIGGNLDRTLLCTSSFVDVIDKVIGVDHWLFYRFSAGKMKSESQMDLSCSIQYLIDPISRCSLIT
jgi:hypothetical protein